MFRIDARKLATICLMGTMICLCACGDSPDKLVTSAQTSFDKRDFNTATIQLKNALQVNPDHALARLLFGRVLMAQNDFVGAERELRKALGAGAKPDDVMPLLISSMTNQGSADKAIAEFAGKSVSDPKAKAELAVALGNAYLDTHDTENAAKQYAAALQAQPGFRPAGIGQARLKLAARDADGAVSMLDAVIKSDPKSIDALLLKGDVLAAQHKNDEAIAVLKSALNIAPDDKQPLLRLIPLYLQSGKQAEVVSSLAALHKVAPNDLRTFYFDGVVALGAGKNEAARDAANKVLRVAPDNDLALVLAASANIKLGDALTAETMLQKAITHRKDWVLPRRLLAQTYLLARDSAHALEIINPLLEKDADEELLSMAGQAYMLAGDFAKATESFAKASSLAPQSMQAKTRLGIARLAAGDEARALQELSAVASKDPDSIVADTAIISAYLRKGDTAKALQAVAALEQKQPKNSAAFNIKGFALLASKDVVGARKAFEHALELQPGNIGAAIQLARLDTIAGKPEDGRKRFEKIVQQEPKNVRALILLAQMQQESKASVNDVRSTLERAVAADPTRNEARTALVQLMMRNGETKQALNTAQQAQAAQPDSAEVLRLLARTQLAAGEKQQAVASFLKLQAAEPNNPAWLMDLADAQRAADDDAGAESSLRKVIEMKPDAIEAYQQLAGLLIKGKRAAEASQMAKNLERDHPESPVGFLLEAEILSQDSKRGPELTKAMQQAYQRAKTPQIVLGLRASLIKEGKTADAQRVVSDWIKENPKEGLVRMQLAEEDIAAGRYAEGLELYKTLHTLAPENIIILNNLAWAANKQSDPKAVDYAEKVIGLAPKVPGVMETAGTIFFEHGQASRGLALLKDAVDLAPKASAVRLGYARALAKSGDKDAARKQATAALDGVPAENPFRKEVEAFIKTL